VAARPRRRALLAVLLALLAVIVIQPVRANFGFGQVNIFLITMAAADVLRRRRRSRGVLIGAAAAVKFTPFIYVVLLVLERDWGAVKRSLVAFLTATGLAWLAAPGASAQYFLHFSTVEKRIGTPIFVSNQSLNGIITRFGLAGVSADLAWLALSLVVGVLAAMVARRLVLEPGRSALLPLFVMATAGLLISPISWDHHWSWVALFPFALLDRSLKRLVKAAFLTVIAVAMAAFYWWDPPASHAYGIPTWFLRPVADDSLALAGLALVVAWAWVLRKEISLGDLSPSSLLGKPKAHLGRPSVAPSADALAYDLSLERSASQRCQRWRKNTSPSRSRALDWPE
jgi:alpha-1,2-mannosyltransferase